LATARLYIALELSRDRWQLALGRGGEQVRRTWIAAGDSEGLVRELAKAKKQLDLPEDAEVLSCCEAGRDGFWVHRLLSSLGIENVVVDAASMRVPRRLRRVKTDRLDADQLLVDLVRHHRGERDVWKVVRVPPPDAEDLRRLPRELERLKKERRQHRSRLLSLFATVGVRVTPGSLNRALENVGDLRAWDGGELMPCLRREIEREAERLALVRRQIRDLEAQESALADSRKPSGQKVQRLASLRGVGVDTACLLVFELFGWRELRNRQQVGAVAGLCGTPYNTGNSEREQGISKAGVASVRTRMVELAWLWLRFQPDSSLSGWFNERYRKAGSRMRRVGIVALARKLLVQLWRYVEHGVVPPGAVLKSIES